MIVRACIKCREYIFFLNDDFLSQIALKRFEVIHQGHPLVTINESELESNPLNNPFIRIKRCSLL